MSTWGEGPFDNDAAVDYVQKVASLQDDEAEVALHATLEEVDASSSVEAWQEACAAAAMIACVFDDTLALESPAAAWFETEPLQVDDEMQTLALQVIEEVLTESPLRVLWKRKSSLEDAQLEMEPFQEALR